MRCGALKRAGEEGKSIGPSFSTVNTISECRWRADASERSIAGRERRRPAKMRLHFTLERRPRSTLITGLQNCGGLHQRSDTVTNYSPTLPLFYFLSHSSDSSLFYTVSLHRKNSFIFRIMCSNLNYALFV